MAGDNDDTEKSEDPTQKKLDDALKRGDVAKSQEVNTWFVIAAATLVLIAFSGDMSRSLTTMMRGLLANAHSIPADGRGLMKLTDKIGVEILAAVAIPFLLLALAAVAGSLVQHRFVWSAEQLKPKFSKVSPIAGLGRLFSKQALGNFVKGLLKLALVGGVMTGLLWPQYHRLEDAITTDMAGVLALTKALAVQVMGVVVAILAIIAAADFLFQYRQWHEKQKMSFQEMKEEFKQTEGDPVIKGKLRQLRMARMRKRMMSNVPKASVVITNPTHFAVALQYEKGMNAPLCLAKGADAIAMKIREMATLHGIPIVENPPLARALHATVEIDEEVPPEHYKAVAEVIGYIMRMKQGLRR